MGEGGGHEQVGQLQLIPRIPERSVHVAYGLMHVAGPMQAQVPLPLHELGMVTQWNCIPSCVTYMAQGVPGMHAAHDDKATHSVAGTHAPV